MSAIDKFVSHASTGEDGKDFIVGMLKLLGAMAATGIVLALIDAGLKQ